MSVLLAALLLGGPAGLGCRAHQHVSRPPSASEIAVINERAAADGPMEVEIRDDRAPLEGTWTRIEAADARALTLRGPGAQARTVPLETVTGVSMVNRERGALVGALSLGTVSGLMGWGLAAAFKDKSCSWDCAGLAGIGLATGALVGALIGYAIGGRTVFTFE
jgi:hypothetical protein